MSVLVNSLFTFLLIVLCGSALVWAYRWALEPLLQRTGFNIALKKWTGVGRDNGGIRLPEHEQDNVEPHPLS